MRIPLRRLGAPEDCATVVKFPATDLSDYVTGQVVCVCGGMVLAPPLTAMPPPLYVAPRNSNTGGARCLRKGESGSRI